MPSRLDPDSQEETHRLAILAMRVRNEISPELQCPFSFCTPPSPPRSREIFRVWKSGLSSYRPGMALERKAQPRPKVQVEAPHPTRTALSTTTIAVATDRQQRQHEGASPIFLGRRHVCQRESLLQLQRRANRSVTSPLDTTATSSTHCCLPARALPGHRTPLSPIDAFASRCQVEHRYELGARAGH